MKLLVTLYHYIPFWNFTKKLITRLKNEFPKWEIDTAENKTEYKQKLKDANAIWSWHFPPHYMEYAKKLQWISTPAAGDDYILSPDIINSNITFTISKGFHGITMSEWVVGMLLMVGHKLYKPITSNESFRDLRQAMSTGIFDLYGKSVLIVGCGSIGMHIAERLSSFGVKTYGLRRSKPEIKRKSLAPEYINFESWFSFDELYFALEIADIVINVLPGNDETKHFFNTELFNKMKDQTIFINIGRGKTVNHDDLSTAIKNDRISYALLDVTDPEPLPPNYYLMNSEKVFWTPHSSAFTSAYLERALEIQISQMKNVEEGIPLNYVVSGPELVKFL